MKKQTFVNLTLISTFIAFGLSSCQSEPPFEPNSAQKGEGITFHISAPGGESAQATRGEESHEQIVNLRYILADEKGRVMTSCKGYLSDNFDRLDLSGLDEGKYTIVFLGSSSRSTIARIEEPSTLNEIWLRNAVSTMPMGGSCFIKKVNFTIEPDFTPMDYEVVLERAMSRIDVEFPGLPSVVESMISSVTLTLDEGSQVYSAINADGSYSGEATIRDYEMCDSTFMLSFTTLPSRSHLSGTINVRSATLSGDSISTTYRFSELNAEAGKVSTVSIDLKHPDLKTGFLKIRPKDYCDYDADLMLMEDEPMSVLHDSLQRSFRLTEPLVLKTGGNRLRVQLYSAAPACNVDVYANFPSLGIDSVHMVHFDKVEALLDMMVPMVFTERKCTYLDIRGRRVTIPKMNVPNDIEWIVKTDDPFITRMKSLSLKNWKVGFPDWETVWPTMAARPDLKSMRHAMVQMINLALTFDSEEFAEELASHAGEYIDADIHYSNEEIMERIRRGGSYGLGANNASSGYNGWGGGKYAGYSSLIVNQAYFAKMYPSESPDTPCNRERECLYHEHAHCLGFSHDGNMTYGSVWTNTVGASYLKAHKAGKIFYHSPSFIEGIPYRRSEAPAWVTPGFAKE